MKLGENKFSVVTADGCRENIMPELLLVLRPLGSFSFLHFLSTTYASHRDWNSLSPTPALTRLKRLVETAKQFAQLTTGKTYF